ncbi:hypothetical protein EGH25_06055 [Haladaptatus sp. F3-133]|jgi:hypothetical protein|uniref:Uncharacterized protein n=1 Tax=Halorutilus salinus TaxID=2487751 RepID=A0A9Q4C608_9EURY|nr:hypothetical protein [Halorutilus salinus]MCX2818911.1 hypothetical protein [Halorutilus salinus]
MVQLFAFPFEGFDTDSLLMVGSLLLVSVLLVQIALIYRRRSSSDPPQPNPAEAGDGEGMVVCPECSQPTEAEYRYCRYCASDTGRSYIGSRGDDSSNGSGML